MLAEKKMPQLSARAGLQETLRERHRTFGQAEEMRKQYSVPMASVELARGG